ncbi:hypothetical protein [Parafilimonas sp.]|uniref:hypothetical protein n=1 Tax=Parafilimonas sp. TaxID=1969739 RepID=UPI0039E4C0ED
MAKTVVQNIPTGGNQSREYLNKLLLDKDNPRFGDLEKNSSQADILDHIVEKFGVDDVLSSLAVNGYFDAEPLVCKKGPDDNFTVAEGNRRLAACLIITGDERASRQKKRTADYQRIWKEHGQKPIDPIPVIIFGEADENKALLSYLGVRHIASSQPWDSYAKAYWVAKVVEENNISLNDIALMIGSDQQTINHLLEGYYFIDQLTETGHFVPSDSVRKGRGSVTDYPFSWVYTMLGYSSTRKFLDMPDKTPVKNPIDNKNLPKAELVVKTMFGDRSKGRNSAITDSRQLGELALALADPEKVTMLEQGKTVEEITRLTRPIDDRLRLGLAQVREIQSDLVAGMAEQNIPIGIAAPLIGLANRNRKTAHEIEKSLKAIVNPEEDDN